MHLTVDEVNSEQVWEEKQDFVHRIINRWRPDVAPHTADLLILSCSDARLR